MPVTVTVSHAETSNGLDLYPGAVLEIESGASLLVNNEILGSGTVELNASGGDPELIISGPVVLTGGTQTLAGRDKDPPAGRHAFCSRARRRAHNLIVGVPLSGKPAVLDNVNFTIKGAGQIGLGDGSLTLINETGGVIDATGLLVIDTGNQFANAGLAEATAGGTLQLIDSVSNTGTVEATGVGALVEMANTTLDNTGLVLATPQRNDNVHRGHVHQRGRRDRRSDAGRHRHV